MVVANYGHGNDSYLHRLLEEFRGMQLPLDVHVMTNVPKDLGKQVTVHVGLPTRNPRSLPFGHRRIFAEHLGRADYFIYCEDDTLITEANIRAFLEASQLLKGDEIPGFLRIERLPGSELIMESAHGPYRWDPASLVRRGPYTFACFTNDHSAFTMASRRQVQRAIDSGGFLVAPHVGRFGMLETAASDLYTQCGLKRLVCISRIEDFLVPHLSNANSFKWGLKYDEFLAHTRALERIDKEQGWKGSLFEVETRLSRGFWSKNLYEHPDPKVLDLIPAGAKTVLSVGSGWGETEEFLAKRGLQVTSLPVDAVFADCQRRRGIQTLEGPFETSISALKARKFDVVLMLDLIHLVPEPSRWLSVVRTLTSPGGALLACVPRTFDLLRIIWYLRGEPATAFPKRYWKSGLQKVSHVRLARWLKRAGWTAEIEVTCNTPTRLSMLMRMRGFGHRVLADRFIVRAKPIAAT